MVSSSPFPDRRSYSRESYISAVHDGEQRFGRCEESIFAHADAVDVFGANRQVRVNVDHGYRAF